MRTILLGAVALLVASVHAGSDPDIGPPWIWWIPDSKKPSIKIEQYDVKADGSCQEIPDSNARGDKDSKVKIQEGWYIGPNGLKQANRPCMTMYWQHDCKDRDQVEGVSLEISDGFVMEPRDKENRTIYRSFRLVDITDPAVRCDGTAFEKMKIQGA